MKLVLISFALLVALSGCGSELQPLPDSPENVATCPAKIQLSEPLLDSKVDYDGFLSVYGSGGFSGEPIQIKKDEDIVVVINRVCMMERVEFEKYPLTQAINLKLKNHKHSFLESHNVKLKKNMDLEILKKYAVEDSCIEIVAPNVTAYTQALPNDPRLNAQTHLSAIQYSADYDWYFSGPKSIQSDTVIAIIDNGVDIRHSDLKDILWVNEAEKNGRPGVDDDRNGYIDDVYGYDFATDVADPNHKYPAGSNLGYSHGTHVAGLAAAHTNNNNGIAGVMAKNAKIMSLNVFGNSDGAMTSNIDSAIRYAADMGAKVINMSLGGRGRTASTESALKYAVGKGAVVVVAAGNDSAVLTSSTFYTPASYGATIDGVITVGATDANPNQVGALCSFSNKSTTYVEVGGPGCDTSTSSRGVLSLLRNNSYGLMPGTSMASPVVAGVASVIFSLVRDGYKLNLNPADVEDILKSGSKNFSTLNSTIQNGKNVDLKQTRIFLEQKFGVLNPPTGGGGNTDPIQPVCP